MSLPRLSRFPAAGILALALVACATPRAPDVPVKAADGVLVGPTGMALYTFDRDTAGSGKSACNGPCAANWPPLMAQAGAAATGDWSVVTRDDGSRQWAYKGKPLYHWSKDAKAGDRGGDGVNNVWHLARP